MLNAEITPTSKQVAEKTYKIWTVIEEHTVFSDGSDEYKDLEDETVSLGHFSTLQGATDQNSLLDELYFGDGDIKENKD